ncbi:MAG: hypothetical protein ACLPJH_16940 [Myxococcaceae bacterium]
MNADCAAPWSVPDYAFCFLHFQAPAEFPSVHLDVLLRRRPWVFLVGAWVALLVREGGRS